MFVAGEFPKSNNGYILWETSGNFGVKWMKGFGQHVMLSNSFIQMSKEGIWDFCPGSGKSERRLSSLRDFFKEDISDAKFYGASFELGPNSPKIFVFEILAILSLFGWPPFWPITRYDVIFDLWFRLWAYNIFKFPIKWLFHFFFVLTFFGKFSYLNQSLYPDL